jgi:hypothetical protein
MQYARKFIKTRIVFAGLFFFLFCFGSQFGCCNQETADSQYQMNASVRFSYLNPQGYQNKLSNQDRRSIETAIRETGLFHDKVIVQTIRAEGASLWYRLQLGGLYFYDVTVVKNADRTWKVKSVVLIIGETD